VSLQNPTHGYHRTHASLSSAKVIRRRVVWLVGKWIGEDVNAQTNEKVNNLVCHAIRNHPSNDIATRLAATTALGSLDTWDDDIRPLLPVLGPVMDGMSQLLSELELPETRRHVVKIFGQVIDRARKHVSPVILLNPIHMGPR
jgi:hypothetical protein